MWIVRLALHRPRTIAVMALLIFLLGGLNILRMPKDIFPSIDVPVVAVIWSYGGLAPSEVDGRVLRQSEAAITSSVSNIEHIEATSLPGQGIIKVYLQPGSPVSAAITQIATTSQSVISSMPQGITPPSIIQYDASDVPIVQLVMSSETEPISKIVDTVSNVIRPQLVTVRGAGFSPTLGGMSRLINVDLDTQAMIARGITAQQVTAAIGKEDIILPAGDIKMGSRDYIVRLNNSPTAVKDFDALPIQISPNGATVFVRDVAHVRNGNGIQVSMVRVNGKAAVLLTVLKNGSASTLDVVSRIKERLPAMRNLLPQDVKLDLLLDQSVFVRAAIEGVVREALIAAGLTGLMILLFLGSWRSTITVAISIPLSILASIVFMASLGQTLNTLTLGGLALAVGMLVDDATVEVENTTRNLGEGYPLYQAIIHSAQQVALPAFTSTLSICIVFIPVVFLTGVAKSLFLPLAMAVVFAMMPSYFLSRTLVTTMMQALLGKELDLYQPEDPGSKTVSKSRRGVIWKVHERFEKHFEHLRDLYHGVLAKALANRRATVIILLCFFGLSAILLPFIGEDFFPKVDAGQMRLHVRVPAGTRLEATGKRFSEIEQTIRRVIPPKQLDLIMDVLGQAGGSAYVRGTSSTIGSADGEIDISLTPDHTSTWDYMAKIRKAINHDYPDCSICFQPADMPTQVLDFGTSAPLDVQVLGNYANTDKNYALAQQILRKVSQVPGVVDSYIYQIQAAPEIRLSVDRVKSLQMGVTQKNVAGNVLVSLSSSSLVAPSYYLDPITGFEYTVSAQTRQYNVPSVDALLATMIAVVSEPTVADNSGVASLDTSSATASPATLSTVPQIPTVQNQTTAPTAITFAAAPAGAAPLTLATSSQTEVKSLTLSNNTPALPTPAASAGLAAGSAPSVGGSIQPSSQLSSTLTESTYGSSSSSSQSTTPSPGTPAPNPPAAPNTPPSIAATAPVSSAAGTALGAAASTATVPSGTGTSAGSATNAANVNVVTQGGASPTTFPGQSSASPPNLTNTGQTSLNQTTIASTGQVTSGTATTSSTTVAAATGQTTPELLSNVATVGRDTTPQIVNSFNTLPVFDVYANVENRDLGGVTSDVEKLISPFQKTAPRGTLLNINGQALTMQTSFVQLGLGLVFAIVLIYLLLTVNFESWIDPLIIVMASPGALCGVLWGLFATRSTFNVPSLMGTIMSVGVATANSILLVTFANDLRATGKSAMEAALEAGFTRFRPVVMTALAMILGMLPMAIGMGDGGEQNAPLGRAVIGGLLVATCTTLIFVPLMYTVLRQAEPDHSISNAGSFAVPGSFVGQGAKADGPAHFKE